MIVPNLRGPGGYGLVLQLLGFSATESGFQASSDKMYYSWGVIGLTILLPAIALSVQQAGTGHEH